MQFHQWKRRALITLLGGRGDVAGSGAGAASRRAAPDHGLVWPAEWIARQMTEAHGWQRAPRYIVRDRDRVYGHTVLSRLRAMGIRDRPIAPRSPWQNDVCGAAHWIDLTGMP
jgi:hypothetical protein